MSRLLNCDFERRFKHGPVIQGAFAMPAEEASVTVLFGPSGCGKTTVLRCLAGLEKPDAGFIHFDGETWYEATNQLHLPPQRRSLGFVFQDYALFPNLSVAGNLGYPLVGISAQEHHRRVVEMIALLKLEGLAERYPGKLSGGQQQRVALGRALIHRPRLLLMDEPLAALDRPSQDALRRELRGVLRELGVPALLVTHDRNEALMLGDRLLLMRDGKIQQDGPPAEVFTRPATPELAQALGIGTVVKVRILGCENGLARVAAGSVELHAPDPGGLREFAHACIRGEGVAIEREVHGDPSTRNRLRAKILGLEPQGALVRLHLDCGFPLEALLTAWACEDLKLREGDPVVAMVKATAIHLIPVL